MLKKTTILTLLIYLAFFQLGDAISRQIEDPPPAIKGHVDFIAVSGTTLIALGWAAAEHPDISIKHISLWYDDTIIWKEEFDKSERPDVVNAMNRSDWLLSGWRIKMVLPDHLRQNKNKFSVQVELHNGTFSQLPFDGKILRNPEKKNNISPFAKGIIVHLFELCFLFSLLFFVKSDLSKLKFQHQQASVQETSYVRGECWIYRFLFFIIGLGGSKYLFANIYESWLTQPIAIIFACCVSYIAVPKSSNASIVTREKTGSLFLLLGTVVCYLGWVYFEGIVLPGHDPIAIPTMASIISQNISLDGYYSQVRSNGGMYPPGFPHLLSMFFGLLSNTSVLLLFKLICLLAVGLIPLAWAWLAKRVFEVPLPLISLCVAFYIAAFGIERTLNHAFPFAGKNAQIFLLAVFPIYFVYLVKFKYRSWLQIVALGYLFYCLILVHYSAIYLAFVLFSGVFTSWFLQKRKKVTSLITRAIVVSVIAIFAVVSFFLFSNKTLHNLNDTFYSEYSFSNGLIALSDIFFGVNSTVLAIFNSPSFQYITSPIRGLLLLGCLLFSGLVMYKTRIDRERESARSIFFCSFAFFIAVVMGAVLSSGVIPSNLTLDFFRWFIFPVQTGIIACGLLSAYILVSKLNGKIILILSIVFLITPLWVLIIDTIKIKKLVDMNAISRSRLQEVSDIMIPGPSGCGVLSQNFVMAENLSYVQKYRILEYVEMLTGCWLVAGSWVHGPNLEWINVGKQTNSGNLTSVPSGMIFYFVGNGDEFSKSINESGWSRIGYLPGENVSVWKMANLVND